MSKRDDYLANAAECQRMVNITRNPDERRMWQGMTESWLRMAKDRARDSPRRSPDANRSAAPWSTQ
jgi:hypothetical protein